MLCQLKGFLFDDLHMQNAERKRYYFPILIDNHGVNHDDNRDDIFFYYRPTLEPYRTIQCSSVSGYFKWYVGMMDIHC